MTTVMKASNSADFLGMVPALAGYTPTRSVVLLPFEGNRTYGVLRMDLPDDDDIEAFAERAAALGARVQRADAAAVVVYCDDAPVSTGDGLVLPFSVLVDHLLDGLENAGLRIVDALCAMPSGWSSYLDGEPRMAPLPPLRRLPGDDARFGDQNDGAQAPAVDLAEKERVGRALLAVREVLCPTRSDRPLGNARIDPQAIAAAELLDDMPQFVEDMLARDGDPQPYESALLLWMLERPVLRDAVLMQWMSDLDSSLDAWDEQLGLRGSDRPVTSEHTTTLMGLGPRPDMSRLHRALELAKALIARAPRAERVGPLTVAAWLSWALGRSTHAGQQLEAAARIDPDYSFAQLLTTLVRTQPLPEWLFESRASDAA